MTRYPQFCALARAAELLGERWSLLIIRELLLGPRRFTDLRGGLDGVSTSVLAKRLADLERDGLVRRLEMGPPVAGTVYELTEHGAALRPAIYELIRWGGRFLLPPRRGERFDPQWLLLALSACARERDAPAHALQLLVADQRRELAIHVAGGPSGTTVEARLAPAELTIRGAARPVFELLTGIKTPAEAAAKGRLKLEGDRRLLEVAPRFFATSRPRPENSEPAAPAG